MNDQDRPTDPAAPDTRPAGADRTSPARPAPSVGNLPTVDPPASLGTSPTLDPAGTSLNSSPTVDPFGTKSLVGAPTPPVSSAAGSLSGEAVPGYVIERELGRGGMGVVYQARHVALKRTVALKMLLAGGGASEKQIERFRLEAESVARFQHPHLVQIFEVGAVNGMPFFALEFCDGGSLERKIAGSPQQPAASARLTETLARAIQAAHDKHIVHRDLKPANVLLTGDGTPKVTDFGLAKPVDGEGRDLDKAGQVLGTPSYMAPEQALGDTENIGPPADVYALGALLYELLTGRPPFRGPNVQSTLAQVLADDPVAPRTLVPGVPRDLETIALKCLQKDPSRRYPSAEAMADDLARFQRGEPITARPVGVVERGVKWAKRKPALAGLYAAGVLLLAAAGVAGAFYVRELNRELAAATQREQRRSAVDTLLGDGREAMKGYHYAEAAEKFRLALEKVADEPSLASFRDEVAAEVARAEGEVETAKARQKDRDANAIGLRHGADATVHHVMFAQLLSGASRQPTRQSIADALGAFRFGPAGPALADSPHLTEAERAGIRLACRELLLLDAEVVSRGKEGSAEALAILDRSDSLGDRGKYGWRLTARCQADLGRAAEAAAADAKSEAAPENSATDLFLTSLDAMRAGGPKALEQARGLLDRAILARPDHFGAQYGRAVCCLLTRDFPEARAGLTMCMGREKGFKWPQLLRGFANTEMREYDLAGADFDEVLAWARGPGGDELAAYVGLVNRGLLRLKQARPADAVGDLREAVALRPTAVQAYVLLAQAHKDAGDLDAAVAELDVAAGKVPASMLVYHTRGGLHLLRKDEEAARRDFEEAVKRAGAQDRQTLAIDRAELGRLRHRAKEYGEAAAEFERALKADPAYVVAHRLRAQSLAALRQDEKAAEELAAYERDGKGSADYEKYLPEVLEAEGRLHARAHRYPEALECYTRSLSLRPSPKTRSLRGWVYLVNGSSMLAEPDFEAALKADPADPDALLGRAECRVKTGNVTEAVRDAVNAMKSPGAAAEGERLYYNACRVYAQAAARTDRPAEASLYAARAMELLERAVETVPADGRADFWDRTAGRDLTLAGLRKLPGWPALAGRYADGR